MNETWIQWIIDWRSEKSGPTRYSTRLITCWPARVYPSLYWGLQRFASPSTVTRCCVTLWLSYNDASLRGEAVLQVDFDFEGRWRRRTEKQSPNESWRKHDFRPTNTTTHTSAKHPAARDAFSSLELTPLTRAWSRVLTVHTPPAAPPELVPSWVEWGDQVLRSSEHHSHCECRCSHLWSGYISCREKFPVIWHNILGFILFKWGSTHSLYCCCPWRCSSLWCISLHAWGRSWRSESQLWTHHLAMEHPTPSSAQATRLQVRCWDPPLPHWCGEWSHPQTSTQCAGRSWTQGAWASVPMWTHLAPPNLWPYRWATRTIGATWSHIVTAFL